MEKLKEILKFAWEWSNNYEVTVNPFKLWKHKKRSEQAIRNLMGDSSSNMMYEIKYYDKKV